MLSAQEINLRDAHFRKIYVWRLSISRPLVPETVHAFLTLVVVAAILFPSKPLAEENHILVIGVYEKLIDCLDKVTASRDDVITQRDVIECHLPATDHCRELTDNLDRCFQELVIIVKSINYGLAYFLDNKEFQVEYEEILGKCAELEASTELLCHVIVEFGYLAYQISNGDEMLLRKRGEDENVE